MSVLTDTAVGVRRILRLDEDVQDLQRRTDEADDRLTDLDRRMVRLETAVQLLGGLTLPPLSPPRLPRG